jgi:hypothetical protein
MSKPLGLTQADYEELENPQPLRKEQLPFSSPPVSWWEKCLLVLILAITVPIFFFLFVTAHVCMMFTGPHQR